MKGATAVRLGTAATIAGAGFLFSCLAAGAVVAATAPSPNVPTGPAAPTGPAGATFPQDRFVLGGNVTLGPTDSVGRDLVVMGGNVLDAGSVGRDLIVMGGNVDLTGTVGRDVVVAGGRARLHGNAQVGRDVSVWGGTADIGEQASVGRYATATGGTVNVAATAHVGAGTVQNGSFPAGTGLGGLLGVGLLTAGQLVPAVLSILIAVLLLVLFPRRLEVTGALLESRPAVAFGLGCLGTVVGTVLAVLCAVTLILLPVSVILLLGMSAAVVFGWAAIFLVTGRRLLEIGRSSEPQPILALLLGGAIFGLAWMIPGLNVLVAFLGGFVALGAAVGSRFGTRALGWPGFGRLFPPPPPVVPRAPAFTPPPAGPPEDTLGPG